MCFDTTHQTGKLNPETTENGLKYIFLKYGTYGLWISLSVQMLGKSDIFHVIFIFIFTVNHF